jgi:hypothetical protein
LQATPCFGVDHARQKSIVGFAFLTGRGRSAVDRRLGFEPRTPIEAGLPRFVAWYREYDGV